MPDHLGPELHLLARHILHGSGRGLLQVTAQATTDLTNNGARSFCDFFMQGLDMLNLQNMLLKLSVEIAGAYFFQRSIFKNSLIVRLTFLGAGRYLDIAELQAACQDKHLGMPRICLVLEAIVREPDDAIQHSDFTITVLGFSDACFNFEFKNFGQALLVRKESVARPKGREVIPVYDY